MRSTAKRKQLDRVYRAASMRTGEDHSHCRSRSPGSMRDVARHEAAVVR